MNRYSIFSLARNALTRHENWRPAWRSPDPKPSYEMVLEAAVNGRADALVTFNRRDYGRVPERFGIELLSPGEALRRMPHP